MPDQNPAAFGTQEDDLGNYFVKNNRHLIDGRARMKSYRTEKSIIKKLVCKYFTKIQTVLHTIKLQPHTRKSKFNCPLNTKDRIIF